MSRIHTDRNQEAWGSRKVYADDTLDPMNPDKLVIHWGGNTDPDGDDDIPTEGEEAAIFRGWQRYHIDGKGWFDLAYNYGAGNTGLTYRGRGWNRSGATSGDYDGDGVLENHEAIALVWIGGAAGTPTAAAYAAMGRLVRDLFEAIGHEVEVTVHSDHKATACPGPEWRAWVDAEGWKLPAVPSDPDYSPDRVFADDWAWAKDAGVMTRHSDPRKTVTKQELAAHMRREVRYQDNGGTAE